MQTTSGRRIPRAGGRRRLPRAGHPRAGRGRRPAGAGRRRPSAGQRVRPGAASPDERAAGATRAPADEAAQGLQLLCTDRAQLARAHGDWLAGELPREPVPLAMSFSASDPTLAPPGQHVVTIWGSGTPTRSPTAATGTPWPRPRPGSSRRRRPVRARVRRLGTAAVRTDAAAAGAGTVAAPWQRHARGDGPGEHVRLPADPGAVRDRVPGLAGLYLTGASTHPGGGVSGNSGRTAARVVLADRRPLARARAARRPPAPRSPAPVTAGVLAARPVTLPGCRWRWRCCWSAPPSPTRSPTARPATR